MRIAKNYVELRWREVPDGIDRFWKAVMKGNVVTLTEGEMGDFARAWRSRIDFARAADGLASLLSGR